jgi:hypothetical protein
MIQDCNCNRFQDREPGDRAEDFAAEQQDYWAATREDCDEEERND